MLEDYNELTESLRNILKEKEALEARVKELEAKLQHCKKVMQADTETNIKAANIINTLQQENKRLKDKLERLL